MQRHRRTSEEKKGGTVHGRVDKTLKPVQKSVKNGTMFVLQGCNRHYVAISFGIIALS